jgi:GAF domain-containing protein
LQLLNCQTVSLFVLDNKLGMLRLYASNLDTPIVVSPGQGIAGSVFNSRETVNIPDCYKDNRFDSAFDRKTGFMTTSMLVVPILDFDGSAVGVIQAINKLPRNGDAKGLSGKEGAAAPVRAVPFKRNDENMLQHLTQHVGIALRNAEVYREAIGSSERATGLLNTIQSLSQDLGTQSMLLTITMHANKIVSAQRSTVFLVDEPNQQLWSVSTDTGQEIRIPKKAGIAGQCCMEGIVIEIPDAYADSRFNQEIDKKTGFKTQSILAVPMFEHGDQSKESVIGVIQMINKVSFDGRLEFFDEADIEVMELFAKFVGPKLTHSSMLSKRHSESVDKKEAEIALGVLKDTARGHSHDSDAAQNPHKHRGSFTLEKLGEGDEEEEED